MKVDEYRKDELLHLLTWRIVREHHEARRQRILEKSTDVDERHRELTAPFTGEIRLGFERSPEAYVISYHFTGRETDELEIHPIKVDTGMEPSTRTKVSSG